MDLNLITLNTKGKLDFDITPSMEDYSDERILSMDGIHVVGSIIDNGTDDYEVSMHIMGTIVLKSSINGNPVPLELDIDYDEFITNFVEIYKKSSVSLDILPIIWENILLEIPIRAVNENDEFAVIQGNGWEILESDE